MTRRLTCCGKKLDLSPSAFGEMESSDPGLDDIASLRQKLRTDGYLLLRGLLDPECVLEARRQSIDNISKGGHLDPSFPPEDVVAASGTKISQTINGQQISAVDSLLRKGKLPNFFDSLLDGKSRVFDYIWLRIKGPGASTAPHCDIVYMNRGTPNLFTTWVPLGDVEMEYGSLTILERSHLVEKLDEGYRSMDIDKDGNRKKIRFRHGRFFRGGKYSKNPPAVQREFGLRWLSADFRAGDVCILNVHMLHGSLDNQTSKVRLSADTRYQLASEPIDERWVGDNPTGHKEYE